MKEITSWIDFGTPSCWSARSSINVGNFQKCCQNLQKFTLTKDMTRIIVVNAVQMFWFFNIFLWRLFWSNSEIQCRHRFLLRHLYVKSLLWMLNHHDIYILNSMMWCRKSPFFYLHKNTAIYDKNTPWLRCIWRFNKPFCHEWIFTKFQS